MDAVEEEADTLEPGFEPFNLREEREHGYYDEAGEYHRKAKRAFQQKSADSDEEEKEPSHDDDDEEQEEPDEWVQSLDEMNSTTIVSKSLRQSDQEKENNNADELLTERSLADTIKKCRQLILFFKSDTESILEVIKRLGRKTDPSWNLSAMNHVTEIANDLLTAGVQDIYSYNKRMLQLEITDFEEELEASEGGVRETMWKYKWVASASPSNQIFGPFSTSQMQDWIKAGYFQNNSIAVQEVRDDSKETVPEWRVLSEVTSFPSFIQ